MDTARCVECGKDYATSELVKFGDAWVCADCKPKYVEKIREGVSPVGGMRPAGFWIRAVAKTLDSVIVAVPNYVLGLLIGLAGAKAMGTTGAATMATMALSMAIGVMLQLAYQAFFLGRFGATPGKMALHLRVVTPEGGPITYRRGAGRALAEFVNTFTLFIGYLMVAFDERKRGLHDRLASTRVIRV